VSASLCRFRQRLTVTGFSVRLPRLWPGCSPPTSVRLCTNADYCLPELWGSPRRTARKLVMTIIRSSATTFLLERPSGLVVGRRRRDLPHGRGDDLGAAGERVAHSSSSPSIRAKNGITSGAAISTLRPRTRLPSIAVAPSGTRGWTGGPGLRRSCRSGLGTRVRRRCLDANICNGELLPRLCGLELDARCGRARLGIWRARRPHVCAALQ